MTRPVTELIIPSRFCGPPGSGNGGWSAGALAAYVDGPAVSVSLLAPPPLDTPMQVSVVDGATVAAHDGAPVLRAEPASGELAVVAAVPAAEALAAEASYAGWSHHPFPGCFACGPEREDGLRIFPGPVAPQDGCARVAGTWTPDPSVADSLGPTTWAALDCVSAWAGGMGERTMVLARMTARVDRLPAIGAEHVVVGLARRTDGRKNLTAAALFGPDGDLVGSAEHLWIEIDPATFGRRPTS